MKLGMFEQAVNPETGVVYTPVSGRGHFNTLKSSASGDLFNSRSRNPRYIAMDEEHEQWRKTHAKLR